MLALICWPNQALTWRLHRKAGKLTYNCTAQRKQQHLVQVHHVDPGSTALLQPQHKSTPLRQLSKLPLTYTQRRAAKHVTPKELHADPTPTMYVSH